MTTQQPDRPAPQYPEWGRKALPPTGEVYTWIDELKPNLRNVNILAIVTKRS